MHDNYDNTLYAHGVTAIKPVTPGSGDYALEIMGYGAVETEDLSPLSTWATGVVTRAGFIRGDNLRCTFFKCWWSDATAAKTGCLGPFTHPLNDHPELPLLPPFYANYEAVLVWQPGQRGADGKRCDMGQPAAQ